MNKYYILDFRIERDSYFAENGKISDQKIIKLRNKGHSLREENINISFLKNEGKLLHQIDNLFSLPVVSQTILNVLLQHCANEVEFYQVKLNFETKLNYYFINILDNIDAIDYEKSKYVELASGIKILKELSKLVLIDEVASKRGIFRLKGFRLRIIVSNKVKEELAKLNLQELQFVPVEDFQWKLGGYRLRDYGITSKDKG